MYSMFELTHTTSTSDQVNELFSHTHVYQNILKNRCWTMHAESYKSKQYYNIIYKIHHLWNISIFPSTLIHGHFHPHSSLSPYLRSINVTTTYFRNWGNVPLSLEQKEWESSIHSLSESISICITLSNIFTKNIRNKSTMNVCERMNRTRQIFGYQTYIAEQIHIDKQTNRHGNNTYRRMKKTKKTKG